MNTKYTEDHEYIRVEGTAGVVGITNYAQDQLGDIVFVELPEIGKQLAKGAEAAVVESVKAASEIFAPVAGEVVAVNDGLADAPQTVNESPEGEGWFLKMKVANRADLDALMDAAAYKAFLETI